MSVVTMVPTAARSRPKTEDKADVSFILNPWSLSVTRHVHPNTGPRQRTMSPPGPDTHSLQLFSTHTDESLAWPLGLFGPSVDVGTIAVMVHIPPSRWRPLNLLLDQSAKGNVKESKQSVFFFFSTLFQQGFVCGHYLGWNYWADKDRGRG